MNQQQLRQVGKEILNQKKIEDADAKTKKLLTYILKQTREEMIRNSLEEVSHKQEEEFREKLAEIVAGKPIQYITNSQEFMGLSFYVDKNVLIPQPDTEILVEHTIEKLKTIESESIQILDLCTGSGAIAISIAKQLQLAQSKKEFKMIATDISDSALEIAKKNAIQNKVEEKIKFIQSDLFRDIQETNFDMIVSNPPYIETKVIETLSKEVRQEPLIALDGGEDGLIFYRAILENASHYLKKGGYVLVEIGYDQGKKIVQLWQELKEKKQCQLEIITKEPIKDFGGNDRVMVFQK